MPSARPLAAFTICLNEPDFLPKWIDHYDAQGIPARDLYVLHELSSSVMQPEYLFQIEEEWPELNVIPVQAPAAFDHDWLRETVADFQHFLLRTYTWVLFAEVDEYWLSKPFEGKDRGLVRWLQHPHTPSDMRATGYEVIHRPSEGEMPLDPGSDGWLRNRAWWTPSTLYSKTTLSRLPRIWRRGFHELDWPAQPQPRPRADLLLVHLHRIDFDLALKRARYNATLPWSDKDREAGHGYQNLITSEDKMRAFFDKDMDTGGTLERLEKIPAWVREAL